MTTIEDIPSDVLWLVLRNIIAEREQQEAGNMTKLEMMVYFESGPSFTGSYAVTKFVNQLSKVNKRWRSVLKNKQVSTYKHNCNCYSYWLFKTGSFSHM